MFLDKVKIHKRLFQQLLIIAFAVSLFSFIGCSQKNAKSTSVKTIDPTVSDPCRISIADVNQSDQSIVEPNDPNSNLIQSPLPSLAEPNKLSQTPNPDSKIRQITEPNVTTSQQPAKKQISLLDIINDQYAFILKNYVNENGLVHYKKLKHQRYQLESLLNLMRKLEPSYYASLSLEDRTAFWINAYNAHMLNIILKNYPIQPNRIKLIFWPANDIRHIPEIWTQKFIVMDEEFTLNEIDQRIFHKEFSNPMIFFAICQAHLSSPPLRNEPYYGSKLKIQLEDQAKKFLQRPTAFNIDHVNQTVWLSNILSPAWYGKDFVSKYSTDKKFKSLPPEERAVMNFISSYASQDDKNYLETEYYTIRYIRHNWVLNEQ